MLRQKRATRVYDGFQRYDERWTKKKREDARHVNDGCERKVQDILHFTTKANDTCLLRRMRTIRNRKSQDTFTRWMRTTRHNRLETESPPKKRRHAYDEYERCDGYNHKWESAAESITSKRAQRQTKENQAKTKRDTGIDNWSRNRN